MNMFLRPFLICFKCPSSVFFFRLGIKKEWPHLFYSDINIFMLKMNQKGVSLDFDVIKKKVASSVF